MREIKFSYILQHDETGRIVDKRYDIEDIENFEFIDEPHGYTLVVRRQFTGLLDKNMVEIYEGDVVTIKGDERKFYIRWFDDMCFAFADVRSDYVKTFYPCYDTSNGFPLDEWIEVIGNIYKHHYLPEVNHD